MLALSKSFIFDDLYMKTIKWLNHTNDQDLENAAAQKIKELQLIENDLPGVVIVHNLPADCIVYLSERGRRLLKVTLEEIRLPHFDYHQRFFNPEDVPHYAPKILGLLQRNAVDEMVTYFQQVRATRKETFQWYSSASKILLWDKEGLPLLGITIALPIDAEHYFTPKIERLIEENRFLVEKQAVFASLSKREKEILRSLALGLSAAEIAEKLFISEDTVKTHRKNIRNKLQAESTFDLLKFAQSFNLV